MAEWSDYVNIKKMRQEKRQYKRQMARLEALPADYRYVFKKIQTHMWQFATGSGYDMMHVHYDLIDLFEESAAEGKSVLEVTGDDVAGFVDELLRHVATYTENWRDALNRDIQKKLRGTSHD
jgi:DNA-binding ferritin-like protein (Dps family)